MTANDTSIAEQLATVRAAAAERGYGLRRNQQPPYGWELHAGDRSVTFGSLDQLERYVRPHRSDPASIERVVVALQAGRTN